MTVTAVTDTGPLIYLAEIDSLDLLNVLTQLFVPETVYEELEADAVPDGIADVAFEIVEVNDLPDVVEGLDPGESAALALALQRDAVLLTDDLAARDVAESEGIEVHGTLGVVILGYSHGRLDRDESIRRLRNLQRETSLYVSDAVVERAITLIEG